jgi:hypothetical protein
MPRESKGAHGDYEYIRSFHVERRECEQAYDVWITTSITTAIRPDRLVIRHEARLLEQDAVEGGPLCAVTLEWPNSVSMSFSAALFRSAVSMTRMVQDAVADLWKGTLRAHRRG